MMTGFLRNAFCLLLLGYSCNAWVVVSPIRRSTNQVPPKFSRGMAVTARLSNRRVRMHARVVAARDSDMVFRHSSSPSLVSLRLSSEDQATQTTEKEKAAPALYLFNSKTRQKEIFQPAQPAEGVSMYTCGPTVYDFAHVGNFRAFLTYDLLKRVLQYFGYEVTHVCNLTDVDDKIIQRATEQGIGVTELTEKYTKLFFQDLAALNIRPATSYPKATEHIDAMMNMIRALRDKELAYETSDGSWYFRTQAQPGYGTNLVQLDYNEMEQTERGEAEGKEHFADFCLWKAFKDGIDREDAAWEADDIAKGRPGWHLECSAMARTVFGDRTIDLHGGGIDLKFPHHENEIAQSEGVLNDYTNNNQKHVAFCNCWFHNGFVNIGDEKMSKSLGNFLTLRNACPTAMDVRAYRYLVASSQYRNDLPFTPAVLKASQKTLKRMDKVRTQLDDALADSTPPADVASPIVEDTLPKLKDNFEAALLDDMNMPRAVASFIGVVKVAEQEFKKLVKDDAAELDLAGLAAVRNTLERMDQVFGIFYEVPLTEEEEKAANDDDVVPEEVLDLVSQRSAAKEARDWELADSLRSRITDLGFAVKDVKGGEPIVSRL